MFWKRKKRFNILERYTADVARWLEKGIPILPPPGRPGNENASIQAAYDEEYDKAYPAMQALYHRVTGK